MLIWEVEHSRPLRRGFKEYRRHYIMSIEKIVEKIVFGFFLAGGGGLITILGGALLAELFPNFFRFLLGL
jgi:hypothetical protein